MQHYRRHAEASRSGMVVELSPLFGIALSARQGAAGSGVTLDDVEGCDDVRHRVVPIWKLLSLYASRATAAHLEQHCAGEVGRIAKNVRSDL